MFTVRAKYRQDFDWRYNGPFATRESAEAFASALATAKDLEQVRITFSYDDNDDNDDQEDQ
jgi:hypothetical protein